MKALPVIALLILSTLFAYAYPPAEGSGLNPVTDNSPAIFEMTTDQNFATAERLDIFIREGNCLEENVNLQVIVNTEEGPVPIDLTAYDVLWFNSRGQLVGNSDALKCVPQGAYLVVIAESSTKENVAKMEYETNGSAP